MKVKILKSILALSLVLGLLSGMLIAAPMAAAAGPTTVTIAADAANYVQQDDPDKVGFDPSLLVESWEDTGSIFEWRSLIHFDLSSIPSGATIESATMSLNLEYADSNYVQYVHRVTSTWVASTVCWNNQPSFLPGPTSSALTGTTSGSWVTWDVGSDVTAFLSGTPNYGWLIKPPVVLEPGAWTYAQYSRGLTELQVTYTEAAPAPVAAFTSDVQLGDAPLTVHFTDQSTNSPTSWAWDFDNDGTVDSTVQNPSHIYAADTYTVKLTATNAVGSDDEVKTDYITVTVPGSSSSLTLNANVVLPVVGIQLDRSSVNYGDIKPGHDSAVETVRVTNTGNVAADVTLQVQGNGTDAQSFYEQSLYVNSALYNSSTVLATIAETLYSDVATQLKVPLAWDKTGAQQAVFIFWAEESG